MIHLFAQSGEKDKDLPMDPERGSTKQVTMNVSLPDALKVFVEEEVRARGYSGASEFVRELLREAKERREQVKLEAKLLEAFTQGSADAESARKAIAEIRKLRVGNVLGPDTSARDLIDKGRK